mmetsp:Transcript_8457/g.17549  ORF Transcript_8457/g.17549 Transcript_8457/m.17549 type:complete len:161 (+) Transcript_8457:900-1382(+)
MGKSESAGALSAFPPVIELRSEKSNVEGSKSTEKTLVLVRGRSNDVVSETFVSFEGSKGGMYDGVTRFFVGLICIELPASNGDGTESGQGTEDVDVIAGALRTERFMDGAGEDLASKGFGTGIDSLSATFVFAGDFAGFAFRLRAGFFLVFAVGRLCCGA